tara:strand:- start:5778 stop:6329 length:552 start_codon:yes stop_codon:yes gene_type:complete
MKTILLSGGIDSYILLKSIKNKKGLFATFINWGQPALEQERFYTQLICDVEKIQMQEIKIDIDNSAMKIGTGRPGSRFVSGRNKSFLTAASKTAKTLYFGAIRNDHNDYPDCRREFFDQMEIELGVKICTPLINKTKSELISENKSLPLNITWSCYEPVGPFECGKCNSCLEKSKSIVFANIK